jgi:hypothetical protein
VSRSVPPFASKKKCIKCNEWKSLDRFYRQSQMRDGYRNDCKACMAKAQKERYLRDPGAAIRRTQEWRERNRERYEAWQKQYRETHREQRALTLREGHLRRKYGLGLSDYQFLCVAQASRCAICHVVTDSLHVDHDHTSGLVRGLLCGNCNKAIGLFHEDPERFHAAERYLRRDQLTLGCGHRKEGEK